MICDKFECSINNSIEEIKRDKKSEGLDNNELYECSLIMIIEYIYNIKYNLFKYAKL